MTSGDATTFTICGITGTDRVYLTTMNRRRNWISNVMKTPRVRLRIGENTLDGIVVPVTAQDAMRHERKLRQ